MKKLISLVLVSLMCFSLAVPSFALTCSVNDVLANADNMLGTIIRSEKCMVTNNVFEGRNSGAAEGVITTSYIEDTDGSYTIYQYINGVLTDCHTTIPDSGLVLHKMYNDNGTITESTEVTMSQARTSVPDRVSVRNMGSVSYQHPITGTIYSLDCTIREGIYEQKEYTFNAGAAKTLADWTASLLSLWAFSTNPTNVISKTLDFLSVTGLLSLSINGFYTVLLTRTVTCNYNNQEFYGDATSPSANYPQGCLEGTYAAVVDNGQTKLITEGYTVTHWGSSNFGRMMLYKVFGIDEAPTSWQNAY